MNINIRLVFPYAEYINVVFDTIDNNYIIILLYQLIMALILDPCIFIVIDMLFPDVMELYCNTFMLFHPWQRHIFQENTGTHSHLYSSPDANLTALHVAMLPQSLSKVSTLSPPVQATLLPKDVKIVVQFHYCSYWRLSQCYAFFVNLYVGCFVRGMYQRKSV